MIHIDLFSGIGGFALAVDEVFPGTEHIFCEIDKYCQELLKKRFEGSMIYGDIRTLSRERFIADTNSDRQPRRNEEINTTETKQQTFGNIEKCDGITTDTESKRINGKYGNDKETQSKRKGSLRESNGCNQRPFLLTGGFPCQPFSQAGKRKGTDDNRYLWPEMLRVIRDFKPTWVIAENVRGLLTINEGMVFEQVCLDLEREGYEVQPIIIPAVAVNAPHRRDRVWFIANRRCSHGQGESHGGEVAREIQCEEVAVEFERPDTNENNAPDTKADRLEGHTGMPKRLTQVCWENNWLEVATDFCGIYDGFSVWMDGHFDKIITGGWDGTGNEEMQVLFKAIQSPEIREAIGGLYEVEGEKVLLETVCQLQKRAGEQERIHLEGETVQEEKVRVLPEYEWIRRSSQERGYYEQLAWKLIDLVQKLSYETALEIVETGIVLWTAYSAFCSREVNEDGLKLSKSRHRVERLKALGNAIVPQVAVEIMKGIKACSEYREEYK